jgi:hypothetical protein
MEVIKGTCWTIQDVLDSKVILVVNCKCATHQHCHEYAMSIATRMTRTMMFCLTSSLLRLVLFEFRNTSTCGSLSLAY